MYQIYFILGWQSTCFGRSFRPSSRVHDCTYSNRHLSNRCCCLLADTFYMFRTVFPSIIRSTKVYIQQQAYVKQLLSGNEMELQFRLVWHMPVAVYTLFNSWWWTERPSETCRLSSQNKINLIHLIHSWFYYRNNITMHGPMNVKSFESINYVNIRSVKL